MLAMLLNLFVLSILYTQHVYCRATKFSFPQCTTNETSHFWWDPLKIRGSDPCQVHAHWAGAQTNCPVILVHHNILAACVACFLFPNDTSAPSASELKTATQNNTNFNFISFSPTCNHSLPSSSHHFPAWAQFSYQPIFDPKRAVNLASHPSTTSAMASPQSAPVSVTVVTSTISTPFEATPTSIPSNSLKRPSSNPGAIAGGVVGAVLFVSLIVIGILYYRRWRSEHQVAPSAEFMFLAGPRETYSRTLNESPPPAFMGQNTSDPVLEKAYLSAEMQRRLDSNDTSAWENHV